MIDFINGIVFYSIASIVVWFNFFKLKRDKQVKGVSLIVWIFYCIWGLWNMIYFPLLDQKVSFIMNMPVFFDNLFWLVLAIKYKYKKKEKKYDYIKCKECNSTGYEYEDFEGAKKECKKCGEIGLFISELENEK